MAVFRHVMSGKVSLRDRLSGDGCLHKRNDDTSSSEARAQCLANWTRLLSIKVDILGRLPHISARAGCLFYETLNTRVLEGLLIT